MSNTESIKISVVTVCLNAEKYLQATMDSVFSQDYPNLEYVVIDGDSTDGTVDIIKKNAGKISFWKSEKDAGIYDAMNKGLAHCSGEWIIFMNAGDRFYGSETLKKVASYLTPESDLVYGDSEVQYPKFRVFRKAKDPSRLWQGMIFSHQSLFTRTNILKEKKFSLDTTNADFSLVLSCLKDGRRFLQLHFPVSSVSPWGVTDSNQLKVILGWRRVARDLFPGAKVELFYAGQILITGARQILKKILPTGLVNLVRRNKNG